ncbi:hypothetical protein J2Z21_009735 [Streptomyces griseochromogenes]|uniref:Uncharacterized protein n=1 Tax=Streptomyces griseochromogenes TaxID=68214 RepID=A0ABS4MBG5_9ACTN|nr:hypothetical protein [Streptomyces griseochromogenes]
MRPRFRAPYRAPRPRRCSGANANPTSVLPAPPSTAARP